MADPTGQEGRRRGRGGISDLHRQLVAGAVARHGAQTKGFPQALRALLKHIDDEDFVTGLPIVPDAFVVDASASTVTAIEAVVTNPISLDKLRSYSNLWFNLDFWAIDLRLIVIERTGVECEVSLCGVWYDKLARRRAAAVVTRAKKALKRARRARDEQDRKTVVDYAVHPVRP